MSRFYKINLAERWKTMDEIKQIAKGANVVEGFIFDKNHRKTSDYQKLASLI